jgi:hypothetical protein
VDPIEKAKETVEKLGVTYPVAYGLDVEAISGITGAYYEKERTFLHPACFLIRPDSRIEVACYSSGAIGRFYSSGAIGRFVAKDVLSLVKFYKSKRKSADNPSRNQ